MLRSILLPLLLLFSTAGIIQAQDAEERRERVQFQLTAQFPHAEMRLSDELLQLLEKMQTFDQLSSINVQSSQNGGSRQQTQVAATFDFDSFESYLEWMRSTEVSTLMQRFGESTSMFRTNMSLHRGPAGPRPAIGEPPIRQPVIRQDAEHQGPGIP